MAPPRKRKFKIIDLTSQSEATMEVTLSVRRDGAVLVQYGGSEKNSYGYGRDWLYGPLYAHPVLIASEEVKNRTDSKATKLFTEAWPAKLLDLLRGEEPMTPEADADPRIYLATRLDGFVTAVLSRAQDDVYWHREFMMKGSEAQKLVEFVNTYRDFYVNGGSAVEREKKESAKLGRAVGVKTLKLFHEPNQYTGHYDGEDWNAYVFPDSGTDTIEFRRTNAVEGASIRVNARTLMERYSWNGYQERPDIRRSNQKWLLVNDDPRPEQHLRWWMTTDVAYNLVYDIYKVQQQGWQTRGDSTLLDMSKVANFPFTVKVAYADGTTFDMVAEYAGRTKDWGARIKLTAKELYGHGLEAKQRTARKLVQRWWFSSVPNRLFVEDVPRRSERWPDLWDNTDTHWPSLPNETVLQLTSALDARYERGLKGTSDALSGITKHGASDFIVVFQPEGEERIEATRDGKPVEVIALSIERNVDPAYGAMATIVTMKPGYPNGYAEHGYLHGESLRSLLQTGTIRLDCTPHLYEVTLNQRMRDQLAVEIDRLEEKGLPVSGLTGARLSHQAMYAHHENKFGDAVLRIDSAMVVPFHRSEPERVIDIAVINVGEDTSPWYAMEAFLERPSGTMLTYLGHTNFFELKKLADTGQLVRNAGYASLVTIDAVTQRELSVVLDQLAEKGLHGLAELEPDEDDYDMLGWKSIERNRDLLERDVTERGMERKTPRGRVMQSRAKPEAELKQKRRGMSYDDVTAYNREYAQLPDVKEKRKAYYSEYQQTEHAKELARARQQAKRDREAAERGGDPPEMTEAEKQRFRAMKRKNKEALLNPPPPPKYPPGMTEREKNRIRREERMRKRREAEEAEKFKNAIMNLKGADGGDDARVWVTPMKKTRWLANDYSATAFRGNQYLGTITVRITKTATGDDVVQVIGIGIKDEAERGKGFGTKLYEAANAFAQEQGMRLVSDFSRTEASEGFWKKQVEKGRAEPVIVDGRKSSPYYYKLKRGQTDLSEVK